VLEARRRCPTLELIALDAIVSDRKMTTSPALGAMPTELEMGLVPGARPHESKADSVKEASPTETRAGLTLGASLEGKMTGPTPGAGPGRMMNPLTSVSGLRAHR
jgi:hypothetical protein